MQVLHSFLRTLLAHPNISGIDSRLQGYSFTFFAPGGLDVSANKLNLDLDPVSFVPDCFRMGDASTGQLFVTIPANSRHMQSLRINRSKFRQLLVDTCQEEGVTIHWDQKLLKFEEKEDQVLLYFSGEKEPSVVPVDLLIGADGTHSRIRDQMIGDKLLYTGITSLIGIVTRSQNPKLLDHPWTQRAGILLFAHGSRSFFFLPLFP